MKKSKENICKFVTERPVSILETINFVFEKKNIMKNSPKTTSFYSMYLVSNGKGQMIAESKSYDICTGTLVFAFPGEEYEISGDDNFEYMYITFKGERAESLFDRFKINKASRVFDGFTSLLPFWQNALGIANSSNLDLISESVLLYTFSQMSENTPSKEMHVTGIIMSYVDKYFSDSTISLSSVAEELGYNPKYISRIFSKNVGMTFSEYLKNTRIKHAVFLMGNGVNTVKNVALLSGYSDPLYFSNVFKSTVGISPADYIKKIHSGEKIGNN